MEGKIIQAIDIGTTKVAAIVARETANKKLEILGVGTSPSFGVIRADVVNIERTIEAIRKAVKIAETQSGIPFKEVYVGIAGSHINSIQHRAVIMRKDAEKLISQEDIDQLKEDTKKLPLPPGNMIVDILLQDFKVDDYTNIYQPMGMRGGKLEANVHVITGSKLAVKNIGRCIREAGLTVKDIVMQPIASAAAVLCKEEMESGVALVDIGGGTTDIAVFVDGVIGHTAVIPFGGEIVTEDIKTGCNISKTTAESIKVQRGCAYASDVQDNVVLTIPGIRGRTAKEISMKMLAEVIQARMEDIFDAVRHELEMSGLMDRLSCGIVLTGGGSQLKHLRQLAEYMFCVDIKLGIPSEHLAKSKVKDIDSPVLSTALGLLIKGMEDESHLVRTTVPVKNPEPTVVEKPEDKSQETPSGQSKEGGKVDDKSETGTKKTKSIRKILSDQKNKFFKWLGEDEMNEFNEFKNN